MPGSPGIATAGSGRSARAGLARCTRRRTADRNGEYEEKGGSGLERVDLRHGRVAVEVGRDLRLHDAQAFREPHVAAGRDMAGPAIDRGAELDVQRLDP